jgi:hypothetical protein
MRFYPYVKFRFVKEIYLTSSRTVFFMVNKRLPFSMYIEIFPELMFICTVRIGDCPPLHLRHSRLCGFHQHPHTCSTHSMRFTYGGSRILFTASPVKEEKHILMGGGGGVILPFSCTNALYPCYLGRFRYFSAIFLFRYTHLV